MVDRGGRGFGGVRGLGAERGRARSTHRGGQTATAADAAGRLVVTVEGGKGWLLVAGYVTVVPTCWSQPEIQTDCFGSPMALKRHQEQMCVRH